jgi:NADPH:quinone reductase-like Zn-dependent oxidoreductase
LSRIPFSSISCAACASWQRLAKLAHDGVLKPAIERTIALEEVADAQRTMESGYDRGKIVVRL